MHKSVSRFRLSSVFSPEVRWVGSYLKRSGSLCSVPLCGDTPETAWRDALWNRFSTAVPPLEWPALRYGPRASVELTRFVVHGLCKFSGCDSLVGEGPGRQAAQGRMGPIFVVVAPPGLNALAGISQRQEPRGVQTFRP